MRRKGARRLCPCNGFMTYSRPRPPSPPLSRLSRLQSAICLFANGIVHDLVAQAQWLSIPVYCHTGTPVYSLPLGLMELALDFPDVTFIMGSAGFADGWYDACPAASGAPNILVETSYAGPQLLERLIEEIGAERVVFGSDAPCSSRKAELFKIRALDLDSDARTRILGGNLAQLLGGDR